MNMTRWSLIAVFGLGICARGSFAANVVQAGESNQAAVISDLAIGNSSVTGTLENRSTATLRDVELILRQPFIWKDELRAQDDGPGRVLTFTLHQDILPNGRIPFRFTFEPLPERTDGHFLGTMEVTGFTEVTLP